MTNTWLRRLLPVVALGVLMTSSGCSELNNCAEASDDVIVVEGGTIYQDGLVFESAPTDGPLTRFPAKRPVRFTHGLGVTPWFWDAELSFVVHGTAGKDEGSISKGAGNPTLMDCMDSDVIVLRNDSCEDDFFVRVVVEAAPDGETGDHSCTE